MREPKSLGPYVVTVFLPLKPKLRIRKLYGGQELVFWYGSNNFLHGYEKEGKAKPFKEREAEYNKRRSEKGILKKEENKLTERNFR